MAWYLVLTKPLGIRACERNCQYTQGVDTHLPINVYGLFPRLLKFHGVRMSSWSISRFEQVDFMIAVLVEDL